MPADVIGGLVSYLSGQLGLSVWDGEVPRYDVSGSPINPDSGTVGSWPVVRVKMPESGFHRTPTFEDPYDDEGPINVEVYGTTRAEVWVVGVKLEAAMADSTLWDRPSKAVPLGNSFSTDNSYYLISMMMTRWACYQMEGVRLMSAGRPSSLCYRFDADYTVNIHGAVPTGRTQPGK